MCNRCFFCSDYGHVTRAGETEFLRKEKTYQLQSEVSHAFFWFSVGFALQKYTVYEISV